MPNMKTEFYGTGNQSWLGSTRGLESARTAVVKFAAFTKATHFPQGYIPSGMPLAKGADGTYGPYGAAPYDTLAGFLATDLPVGTDPTKAAALLDFGRVVVAKLPVVFTVPAAAKDATTIVFV